MELFGYASLIGVGLLLGMMRCCAGWSRFQIFDNLVAPFHLQHTDISPKPVFGLARACGRVRVGMRAARPGSAVGKMHLEDTMPASSDFTNSTKLRSTV